MRWIPQAFVLQLSKFMARKTGQPEASQQKSGVQFSIRSRRRKKVRNQPEPDSDTTEFYIGIGATDNAVPPRSP